MLTGFEQEVMQHLMEIGNMISNMLVNIADDNIWKSELNRLEKQNEDFVLSLLAKESQNEQA